jgi:hypothetical protein
MLYASKNSGLPRISSFLVKDALKPLVDDDQSVDEWLLIIQFDVDDQPFLSLLAKVPAN